MGANPNAQKPVDYLLLKLTFVPYINPDMPRITMSYQRQTPSSSLLTVRDWFRRVMNRELTYHPPNSQVSFTEWNIMTGNGNLFKVGGNFYDRVVLIFGEEKVHWVYYRNMPLHNQYKRIIKTIIKYMEDRFSPQILSGTPRS